MYLELQKFVRERGPLPVITWLSDVGRIELSAITFNNAINKASNFLIDGLEVDEDSSIAVMLGNHWQAPVWFGASFTVGIKVTDAPASITFGTLEAAQSWSGSSDQFVIISQDPFGMPDKEVPTGFVNGSAEVRNFGDYFAPTWSQKSQSIVLSWGTQAFTWSQLVTYARQIADQEGISAGKTYGFVGASNLVTNLSLQLVLPIINGNSVVLINQETSDLNAIMKQEKLDKLIQLG